MATTFQPHPNNVSTTLAAAYTSGGTTLAVAIGTGSLFGSTFPMRVTVATAGTYGQMGEINTIYSVTGRTGDTLTIAGPLESTTSRSYAIGDRVDVRFTDGMAKAIEGAVNALENSVVYTNTTSVQTMTGPLLVALGSIATNTLPIKTTATWTGGVAYGHWQAEVTDTSSLSNSYLQIMKVNNTNVWLVDKTGKITTGAADGALLTTGTVAAARLGSGTAAANTILWGDGVWRRPYNPVTYNVNSTIANNDTFIYCNPSANLTLTMPAVSAVAGQEFIVFNATTSFTITLQRSGTDIFFLGATSSLTLPATQGKYIRLLAVGGVGWMTVGGN